MSTPRVVLVDGTDLMFRAFDTLPTSHATRAGRPTNAILGFAKMFRRVLQGRAPSHGAVFFDTEDARPLPEALQAQVPGIADLIRAHGFTLVHHADAEALLTGLCRQALAARAEVTLVSSNQAFFPLLDDDRVRVFDSIGNVVFDADRARRVAGTPLPPMPEAQLELPLSWDGLPVRRPTVGGLNAIYRRFELYSLLTAEGPSQREGPLRWYVVDTLPMIAAALQNECLGPDPIAVSVLTELEPVHGDLVGLALSPKPGTSFYFPFRGPGTTLGHLGLQAMRPWLENPAYPKVTHDGKLAIQALRRQGIELRGLVGDTALASYLLDPTRSLPHTLDQVARHTVQRGLQPLKAVIGSGRRRKRFDTLTVDRAGAWTNHLADAIGSCWRVQREQLGRRGLDALLLDVDLPLAGLLADLELTGILLDPAVIRHLGDGFRAERDAEAAAVHDLVGHPFNLGSPKQLGTVLFEELQLPVIKRTKTGYSTAAAVLDALDHPVIPHVKRWRTLENTWTEVLVDSVNPRTGRIHPTFQQTASASGRLITTEPDLQRTPVRNPEFLQIREAFVAPDGWSVLSADWSQIELRILAHLSRDERLLTAYRTDTDLHRQTAAALFGVPEEAVDETQRQVGKSVNFATVYGQGPTALAEKLGVPHAEARRFIETFFWTYTGVAAWRTAILDRAHQDGFVETLGGRRRYLPELSTRTWADRAHGERVAVNTPIQGSAADLCKLAMLDVDRRLKAQGLQARMTLQIHDELLFEVPDDEVEATAAAVRESMETVWELAVPLVVDVGVGASWAACKG